MPGGGSWSRFAGLLGLALTSAVAAGEPCDIARLVKVSAHDDLESGSGSGSGPRQHDLRFEIPVEDARYRAFDHVGALYVPTLTSRGQLRKTGSGTLIDRCHVLTAYHVVFPEIDLVSSRPRVFQFDPERVVMFRFGRLGKDQSRPDRSEFAHAIEGHPVDLGVFDPYAPSYADELLLVRLNRAAPPEYTPIDIDGDADYVPGDMDFVAAGYPLDGVDRDGRYRLIGDRCSILGPDRISGYATNCSLTAGISGGALFRVSQDPDCLAGVSLRLAGVPNQQDGPDLFPKDDPRRRSYVVPIRRNLAVLQRALTRDPCPAAAEPR